MKIDYLPFAVNIICATYYTLKWEEPGKIIYWLGAAVLGFGLIKMKG